MEYKYPKHGIQNIQNMEYKISKTWNTIDTYPKHGIQLIISKTWNTIDKYPKHGI